MINPRVPNKPLPELLTRMEVPIQQPIDRVGCWLRGKRVIFVGPAAYLTGKKLGKWIDSFDVVVRANRSRPIPEDYGSRTDILYHFMTELWSDYFIGNKNFVTDRIRITVVTTTNKNWYQLYRASLSSNIYSAIIKTDEYKALKNELGSKPNTGTVAINNLLSFDIASLTVVGVDLYDSAYCAGYGGDLNPGTHDFDIQALYLHMLAQRNPKLIIDDALRNRINRVLKITDDDAKIKLPKMSLLIPYKSDHGHRDDIFNFSISRYKKLFPEFEICVGENNDEPFNRAMAKNDAFKKATHDILCIVDADALFSRQMVANGLNTMKVKGWTRAGSRSIRMTKQSTLDLFKAGIPLHDFMADCEGFYSTNFFCLVMRKSFEQIGGFDEQFKSWGGEDFAFYKTLKTYFGDAPNTIGRIFHIWHEFSDGAAIHMQALKNKLPSACETAARHMQYQQAKTVRDIINIREGQKS